MIIVLAMKNADEIRAQMPAERQAKIAARTRELSALTMVEYTTYRSYHGGDVAKAIQFYWPRVSPDEAKTVAAEMSVIDWSEFGDSKDFHQAKWFAKRLAL